MRPDNQKSLFQQLCHEAIAKVREIGTILSSYRGLSPFNDTSRNAPFTSLPSFGPASSALHGLDGFDARMGQESAENFTLQFIFNFLGKLPALEFDQIVMDDQWNALIKDIDAAHWTYFSIANLQNFATDIDMAKVADGLLIRSRNYEEISKLLNWSEDRIDATLGRDWYEGSAGTHVMIATSEMEKKPDNLVLVNDLQSIQKISRSLLALRLADKGFVGVGRVFFGRKANFRFGIGGISSSGFSRWSPGTIYELRVDQLAKIQEMYTALECIDKLGDQARALQLALRRFTSIYDRDYFRTDDRLVDSITAIEAALRLDTDLSFRSSFQVAGLLASSDDERISVFREMRTFYDTRSKVVHGGEIKTKHQAALGNYERLVDIVRHLLSAFTRAAAANNIPATFYDEIDATLQHAERRSALQKIFGWGSTL